jgi:hypothetical protein
MSRRTILYRQYSDQDKTMTIEELRAILSKSAGLKLDFKREYKLNPTAPATTDRQNRVKFVNGQWCELIKDMLGRVCKLQPLQHGGDGQHGLIVVNPLLLARGDPTPLFEAIDPPLQPAARAVHGASTRAGSALLARARARDAEPLLSSIWPARPAPLSLRTDHAVGAPLGAPWAVTCDGPAGPAGHHAGRLRTRPRRDKNGQERPVAVGAARDGRAATASTAAYSLGCWGPVVGSSGGLGGATAGARDLVDRPVPSAPRRRRLLARRPEARPAARVAPAGNAAGHRGPWAIARG